MIGDLFRELPTISFKIFKVYLHRLDNLRAASALHLRYQTSTEISSILLYLESYLRVCISNLSNLFFLFFGTSLVFTRVSTQASSAMASPRSLQFSLILVICNIIRHLINPLQIEVSTLYLFRLFGLIDHRLHRAIA